MYFYLVILSILSIILGSCSDDSKRQPKQPDSDAGPSVFNSAVDWSQYKAQLTVIGDSIATGVFADTEIGDVPLDIFGSAAEDALKNLDELLNKDRDTYLKSIEESAYHVDLTASGTKQDWGVLKLLSSIYQTSVDKIGFFQSVKTGDRSSDLTGHVDTVLADTDSIGGHYFVMLGANDFCGGRSAADFKKDMTAGLVKLLDANASPVNLMVAYLPPIDALSSQLEDEKVLEMDEVVAKIVNSDIKTCHDFRTKYCERMYEDEASNVIENYNQAVDEMTKELQDKYQDHRVKAVEGVSDMSIEKPYFGFDCFHPSVDGQNDIATAIKRTFE